MSSAIVCTEEAWLPALSEFLGGGFTSSAARYCVTPEVLRWKFFAEFRPWSVPRSFVVRNEGGIEAHVGVATTEFTRGASDREPVRAVHMTDWLTARRGGFHGTMLMFKAFTLAPVQFAFASTAAARNVILAAGFRELHRVPLFHKVLAPWRADLWRELNGPLPRWPPAVLVASGLVQTSIGWSRRLPRGVVARPVEQFGDEVAQVVRAFGEPVVFTTRDADLLNHLIRHPSGCVSGWLLEKGGRVRGFALLSRLDWEGLRVARVVELFLDCTDRDLWYESLAELERRLRAGRPHLISAYGSTPWMENALRRCGFFRRGRSALCLRDPDALVDCAGPMHVTHLEADLAYI